MCLQCLATNDNFNKRRSTVTRLRDFKSCKQANASRNEGVPKFVLTKFSDEELQQFIERYYERKQHFSNEDKSSIFGSTTFSHGRNSWFSVDRESRDSRFLDNYETNRKRWQKYANILSKKVGKACPESSLINAPDFYVEDLQKKEDFDEVQDKNMQKKLNQWYGTLRLSPLDGKLNRNYVPVGKNGYIWASETIHNKTRLLMKKPKELLLFGQKPRSTSILEKWEGSRPTISRSIM